MDWGMAFKDFVDGFQTGAEWGQERANKEEERKASATRRKALEFEYSPEMQDLRRQGLKADIEATRAGAAHSAASTRAIEFDLSPEEIARKREGEDINRANVQAQTGTYKASTEGQEIENTEKLRKLQQRYSVTNAIRRRMGMDPVEAPTAVKPGKRSAVDTGTSTASLPEGMTQDDRDLAVRMIAMEAGGEPEEGKQGVANVILNRWKSGRYGKSVTDVITADNQFEPWETRRRELWSLDRDSPAYKNAEYALEQALQGDITGGATHFLNRQTVLKREGRLPAWDSGTGGIQIGLHTFLAPEGRVAEGAVGADRYAPSAALAYADTGTMSDADTPEMQAASRATTPEVTGGLEGAVMAGLKAMGSQYDAGAVDNEEDDDMVAQQVAQNTADPQDVERALDVLDEQGLTKGMSEGQAMMTLLYVSRQEALMDGDIDKANAISGALMNTYYEAFSQYTNIAKAAAEKGDMDEATEAMVRAYAFVPDGMDIEVEKKDKGFTIIQKDMDGKEVARQEAISPDDMFKMITAVEPTDFGRIVAASAGKRQQAVFGEREEAARQAIRRGENPNLANMDPENVRILQAELKEMRQAAGSAGKGGRKGLTVSDMGQLQEQTSAAVPEIMQRAYGEDTPLVQEEVDQVDAIARMAVMRSARAAEEAGDFAPQMMPRDAVRTIVAVTGLKDDLTPANPVVQENEDGSAVYQTGMGKVVLGPQEHTQVQALLQAKIAREKAARAQPGMIRGAVQGAIEGWNTIIPGSAGPQPGRTRQAVPINPLIYGQ